MNPSGGPVADWAIHSKNPGAAPDYAILQSSFDATRARKMIRTGIPGNPDAAATEDDRLPWVAFVTDDIDGPVLGVVVTLGSDQQDYHGRLIAPSRLLMMRFDEAAGHTLTFRTSVELMDQLQGWDAVNQGPPGFHGQIEFAPPPPPDHGATARLVDALGFDWVAAVAGALLDRGQVAIVCNPPYPSLSAKIGIFDAIASLLPYAYRVQLSTSTWASDRTDHTLRLTFASRAREGQAQAQIVPRPDPAPAGMSGQDWVMGGAPPEPISKLGRAYRHALHELRQRGRTTADLVTYLASQRNPEGCHTAEEVLERLLDLDLPMSSYQEIMDGRGSLDKVGRVLAGSGWSAWTDVQRAHVIDFVANAACTDDQLRAQSAGHLLRRHWTPEVARHLGGVALNHLQQKSTGALRRWAAVLEPGQAQQLLVVLAENVVRHEPGMVSEFADLLWRPAEGTSPWAPEVQTPFLDHPTYAAYLLNDAIQAVTEPDRLFTLLKAWDGVVDVAESRTGWLRPFAAAVGDLSIEASEIEALRRVWPAGIVAATRACLLRNRLGQLPPSMWNELVRYVTNALQPGREAELANVRELLEIAVTRNLTDRECARVDLLGLAIFGGLPASHRRGFHLPEDYFREIATLWHQPSFTPLRETLQRIATFSPPDSAATLHRMRLADAVGQDLLGPTLHAVMAFMNASWDNWKSVIGATDQRWAEYLKPYYGEAIELRRLCERDADRLDVVMAAVGAVGRGTPLPIAGGVLCDWALRHQNTGTQRLLGGLAEAQSTQWQPPFDEALRQLTFYVLSMVAHGHFGDPKNISRHQDTLKGSLDKQNKQLQQLIKNAGKRK